MRQLLEIHSDNRLLAARDGEKLFGQPVRDKYRRAEDMIIKTLAPFSDIEQSWKGQEEGSLPTSSGDHPQHAALAEHAPHTQLQKHH